MVVVGFGSPSTPCLSFSLLPKFVCVTSFFGPKVHLTVGDSACITSFFLVNFAIYNTFEVKTGSQSNEVTKEVNIWEVCKARENDYALVT